MFARVCTFTLDGLHPRQVWVEVDVRPGLPAFAMVGLGDTSVREARERVRAAIANSGLEFPQRRITVNLAPASLPKAGPGFDLAIACGLLAASGQLPASSLRRWSVFGELGLEGELRVSAGALAVAEGARRAGVEGILLPRGGANEAALVEGIAVAGVTSLLEAVAVLGGADVPDLPPSEAADAAAPSAPDLADVRGHALALSALEIAAAGGHNILLTGAPGVGKTMLARRLAGVLPPLTAQDALEVTRIHSIAGAHNGRGLVQHRPFRAPHHTISASGLVGGGAVPRPGEVTLAHHGVLFLDELSEFSRSSLEALRQPLEDGEVSIVRGQRRLRFPTSFVLVAATNPCPCGFRLEDRCRCMEPDLARHDRRLSGPLLDRIDLHVALSRPTAAELGEPPVTSSAAVRARVLAARDRQGSRAQRTGAAVNARLSARALADPDLIGPGATRAAISAYARRPDISARGHGRVLRVARTVADLAGHDAVTPADVEIALQLRNDPIAEERRAA